MYSNILLENKMKSVKFSMRVFLKDLICTATIKKIQETISQKIFFFLKGIFYFEFCTSRYEFSLYEKWIFPVKANHNNQKVIYEDLTNRMTIKLFYSL